MSRRIIIGLVVVVLLGGVAFAATTDDVTLTVTPGGVGVTITATPNSYAFGTVNLSLSSASVTGILLSNTGTVGAAMDKKVQDITSAGTAWSLAVATGASNKTVLWCFSQETLASIADFGTVGSYDSSKASFVVAAVPTAYNALKDSSGNAVTINAGKGATTWYRIDVPNTVSASDAQSIVVRFLGTAQ